MKVLVGIFILLILVIFWYYLHPETPTETPSQNSISPDYPRIYPDQPPQDYPPGADKL